MSTEIPTEVPADIPQSDTPAATLPASTTDSADAGYDPIDPDGVLDRLTEPDTQTKEPVAPVPEAKPSEEPVAADDADADIDAALPEADTKGMSERTKKRFDRLLADRKELKPLADWSASILTSATKKGVRSADLSEGMALMVGFLSGNDKEADARLVKAVRDAGLIQDAPPSRPDFSSVRGAINKLLKVDYAISEEAAASVMAALDAIDKPEKLEAPKPAEKPAADPAADMYHKARAKIQEAQLARVRSNIARKEAEFQAKHPAEWGEIRTKAYEEVARMEKNMPPEELGDTTLYTARLVEAVHTVLASRSQKSAVRPPSAIRSSNPPPTSRKLEKGTPEYEDAVMDGAFDRDNE